MKESWRRMIRIERLALRLPRFSRPIGEPTPASSITGTSEEIRTLTVVFLRHAPPSSWATLANLVRMERLERSLDQV